MNEADKKIIEKVRNTINFGAQFEKAARDAGYEFQDWYVDAREMLRIIDSQALEIERLKRELSLPWEMKS